MLALMSAVQKVANRVLLKLLVDVMLAKLIVKPTRGTFKETVGVGGGGGGGGMTTEKRHCKKQRDMFKILPSNQYWTIGDRKLGEMRNKEASLEEQPETTVACQGGVPYLQGSSSIICRVKPWIAIIAVFICSQIAEATKLGIFLQRSKRSHCLQ